MVDSDYRRPIDLINEAKGKSVPGFKRLDDLRCCYHCRHMKPSFEQWVCEVHNIIFGGRSGNLMEIEAATALQAEFVCDDWESCNTVQQEDEHEQ